LNGIKTLRGGWLINWIKKKKFLIYIFMPNANFNSFLANYRSSIACKKIRFCIPRTVLNFFILKTLLADGYIRSFSQKDNKYEVISIDLATTI